MADSDYVRTQLLKDESVEIPISLVFSTVIAAIWNMYANVLLALVVQMAR